MTKRPKIITGQKIKLVQVTGGDAIITGYVKLSLFFQTDKGPVQMDVEAYVVRGMSTAFILGNDFAEQYSLSLLRSDGKTELVFGESGRKLLVSESPIMEGQEGLTFKVHTDLHSHEAAQKRKEHRKRKSQRRKAKKLRFPVVCSEDVEVAPETSRIVPLRLLLQPGKDPPKAIYLERTFFGESDDIRFAFPDTLTDSDNPRVHITNFSSETITLRKGDRIGEAVNPEIVLDSPSEGPNREAQQVHCNFLKQVVESHYRRSEVPDLNEEQKRDPEGRMGDSPVDGGPKTAETVPEDIKLDDFLKEIDISPHLDEEQRGKLINVLWENREAFSLEGRLGHYHEEVRIPLKPEAKPVSLPPFPLSPEKREVIDKQMDAWLKLEVIEPSRSPWAAPVFTVYRNNKPRMVIDLRKLNEQVIPDEFPLPRQEDILQSLEGSQYLSSLDALAGFTQLSVHPDSRPLLAFRTHRGLFQFKRMPFGYRNGPSVFQRVMQGVLSPYLWIFTLVYIDDIVVYSKTFDEHLSHLGAVLSAIRRAKITLSPPKCHFAYESILLLGQKVSRLGLSTNKEKVEAITQLAEPRNINELQTFLGMMVYFASYIPYYAWIAHPLFQLLKKKSKWEWGPEQQKAFELCKQALTEAPVRGHAMPGRPYRVYSDACDYALAAILQQVQPIAIRDLKGTKVYERLESAYKAGNKVPQLASHLTKEESDVPDPGEWARTFEDTIVHVERVIAYWSRVLQSAERNYSPTEREALALKEGLIKFQMYLEGERIFAITDHAALTWSRTFQNVNRRLLSWGLVYAAFPNMKIVHRAGRVHSNVDPISRLRRRAPEQQGPAGVEGESIQLGNTPINQVFDTLGPDFEQKLLEIASNFVETEVDTFREPLLMPTYHEETQFTSETYSLLVSIDPSKTKRWTEGYSKDKYFHKVRTEVEKGDLITSQRFTIGDNGLLYFWDNLGNARLCVPEPLVHEVTTQVHEGIMEGAHEGIHKTYNRLSAVYYWPRMSRTIKQFVQTCDVCQKIKPKRHGAYGLLQSIPVPTVPFEVITMDFIPDLPISEEGFNNVLVIVDKLTKFATFIPTYTTLNERQCSALVVSQIFLRYGLPLQIISDRDARWTGGFWKETCRIMGISRALTTSYHPQGDGQTEVMNQYLEISLRAYLNKERTNWASALPALAFSYNASVHTGTKTAPFFLLHGYHPRTPGSLLHSPEGIDRDIGLKQTLHDGAVEIAEAFEAERRSAQDALIIAQLAQQREYNKGRKHVQFQEGDLVLINLDSLRLRNPEKGRGTKLLAKYAGPFQVNQIISANTYRLRMPASYGMHPVFNIAHLERYKPSPDGLGTRSKLEEHREGWDSERLREYEVDEILSERTKKGRKGRRITEYRVRWKGFAQEEATWEPEQHLKNAPEAIAAWKAKKQAIRRQERIQQWAKI